MSALLFLREELPPEIDQVRFRIEAKKAGSGFFPPGIFVFFGFGGGSRLPALSYPALGFASPSRLFAGR